MAEKKEKATELTEAEKKTVVEQKPKEATKSSTRKTTARKTTTRKTAAKKNVSDEAVKAGETEKASEVAKSVETEKASETEKAGATEKTSETEKSSATGKTTSRKTTRKKTTETKKPATPRKTATRKTAAKKAEEAKAEVKTEEVKKEEVAQNEKEIQNMQTEQKVVPAGPKRKILFVGSECYPFVKTGGLGDVMYALPKALNKENCDVRVMLPKYACIPWEYREKMQYINHFYMDLCKDGKQFYIGVLQYEMDGVIYYFIDNDEMFGHGNPYVGISEDIPRYILFSKAVLAALPVVGFYPDVIHCHDWQTALVPVYLRTLFNETEVSKRAVTIMTIHNLKFQGVENLGLIRYWSGLPDYVFNDKVLKDGKDGNLLKGGLTYCNKITTVSNTYAGEIKTDFFGEHLNRHIAYHHMKLCGIVNGIDCDMYNPAKDGRIAQQYTTKNAVAAKKKNKLALQQELGLVQDENKFVIGIISRLTDQKGLDLINRIMNAVMDEHTQVVLLGTGDANYEHDFRYYENHYRGRVCSNIMYSEDRAHRIYAGADALLVPSLFEPCGLTQLIAMHYGTIPIVRETGGLKDTVEPYNEYEERGNGFTFDAYNAGMLLKMINYAKTVYFTRRESWDKMVIRDMEKDVSWENSAKQYRALYDSLCN